MQSTPTKVIESLLQDKVIQPEQKIQTWQQTALGWKVQRHREVHWEPSVQRSVNFSNSHDHL